MPLSPSGGAAYLRPAPVDDRRPTATLRRLATPDRRRSFPAEPDDDVNATFTQVMQELHYQYVLGFTPQRFDGKVHDLRVRPGTRPGLEIRARRNYRALKPVRDRAIFRKSPVPGDRQRTELGAACPTEADSAEKARPLSLTG